MPRSGSSVTGPDVPLGSYTLSGTGGADVGAFSATITIGGHLAISNKSALNAVDPAQPFTVTWTGGVAGNYILIAGYTPSAFTNNQFLSQAFFYCAEDGGKGSLTIPGYILTAMNAASNAQGVLLISPHPLSNQIQISGLDLAYFADGSSDSANVTWSVPAAPAAPVLISPSNAATGVPTNPALTWSASPGATSYAVSLGTSSSPSQVATVSGTTYSPSSLSANTTYYWNVMATNATGSATSPTFNFTTQAVVTREARTITFGPIGNQTLAAGIGTSNRDRELRTARQLYVEQPDRLHCYRDHRSLARTRHLFDHGQPARQFDVCGSAFGHSDIHRLRDDDRPAAAPIDHSRTVPDHGHA